MSYNTLMKVWRGFTLTIWVVVLTLLATFAMQYRSLQATALDASHVKTQLVKNGAYENLRDTLLLERLRAFINNRYPGNTLIDTPLLRTVLTEVLPRSELQKRIDPIVDSTYRWLDSKEPEVSFSVDLSDKKEVFYRSLEVQLGKKIATLPSCGDYRYPPEDAILVDKCLPVYINARDATDAIMTTARATEFPLGDTVASDTFELPKEQVGTVKQIPTYLNYLWVLNLVAIIVFAIIALLLLVTRRVLGIMAIGISLVLAGLAVWTTTPLLGVTNAAIANSDIPLLASVVDAFIPSFIATSLGYAQVSLVIGAVLLVSAGGWKWWRKGRHTHA